MIAALRRGLRACGLALALAATSVLADVAAPFAEAEAAIRTGDPAKALRLLSSLTPSTPEEAERRHWALAVAHATLGNPEGAVPHLEALVAANPANTLYRLELGRALAAAGKSERARFHLTRARAAGLAAEDEARALRSLASVGARQKPLQGWLRFGLSPQSNPAQATPVTVFFQGQPLVLGPTGAGEGAAVTLQTGLAYSPRLSAQTQGRLALSLDATRYSNSLPDDATLRAEMGLSTTFQRAQFGAALGFSRRQIGGALHAQGPRLTFNGALALSAQTQLSATLFREHLTHPNLPGLDGPRTGLDLRLSHALSAQTVLYAGASAERLAASTPASAERLARVSLGFFHSFSGGLGLGAELYTLSARRDGPDPLFNLPRKDRRNGLTLRVQHAGINAMGFAPVLEIGLERQRSTVPLYTWQNARVGITLTRAF